MQSVWRNRDFLWLVGGQTVSEFGSAIMQFAVPWLILQLTGSVMQMGFAFAVGFTPYLLLSLPAGVWADRHNRKHIMIAADAVRMLLVVTIPLSQWLGVLSVWQLYVVLAGMSASAALFDTAYVACLPNVVARDQLPQANSILQTGISASQILGPALAGLMVGWFGAANTVVLNGLTYLVSVLSLLAIRKSFSVEHALEAASVRMLPQIVEGLKFVWQHALVRTIALFTTVANLASSAVMAVLLFHLQHNLHLSAHTAGIIMAMFSVGALVGSLASMFVSKHLRMGRIMALGASGMTFPVLLMAAFPSAWLIGAANFLTGVAGILWNVQSMSLRQTITPDHLLGRVSSAIRMVVWGTIPAGSAAGGVVGQWFGAPAVFLVAGVVQLGCFAWGWFTPLFRAESVRAVAAEVGMSPETPTVS